MKYLLAYAIFALAVSQIPAAGAGELVVVANAESGAGKLSRDQVLNIFLGRFRQFPSGVAAEPIDQPDGGPLKAQFYRWLVDKEVSEINAYWARLVFSGRTAPPYKTKSSVEVLSLLAEKKGGIAYIDRADLDHRLVIVFDPGHEH